MGRGAPLATLLVAVLLVFSNGLFAEFVWDDETIILSRADFLGDASNIPTVLAAADSTDTEGGGRPYDRPISLLSFMLDTWLWGHDPFGYHLENLLLHALVSVLLFLLAEAVFGDRMLAWLTAMLFAVHPVESEAVSFISARNNPLCAVLFFFSLWRRSPEAIRGGAPWILCGLVPISNLVAIPSAPVAERYLYAVVPGAALAGAWLLRRMLRWNAGIAAVAIGLVLVAFGFTAFPRNRVWADNLT